MHQKIVTLIIFFIGGMGLLCTAGGILLAYGGRPAPEMLGSGIAAAIGALGALLSNVHATAAAAQKSEEKQNEPGQ